MKGMEAERAKEGRENKKKSGTDSMIDYYISTEVWPQLRVKSD